MSEAPSKSGVIPESNTSGKKKARRTKITKKQQAALALLEANPKMSKGEAMRQAGYSDLVARNPSKLTRAKSVLSEVEKYARKLTRVGIDNDLLAHKLKTFLEATKENKDGTISPDYTVQLQAYDRAIKHLHPDKSDQPSRRITLEEWLN